MEPFASSLARMRQIAANTLTEALRQRLVWMFALLGAGLIGGAQYLREFNFGTAELKFLADLGFGALGFFGAVLAVVATAQSFFGELEGKTAQAVLARPVSRAEFIAGKLGGIVALLGLFAAVLTVVLVAVLRWRESALLPAAGEALAGGALVPYGAVAACGALLWVKLCVIAAMTLCVGSYANSALFAVVVGFALTVIGHLQYLAHELPSTIAGWALKLPGLLFPNFQLFNLADLVAGGNGLTPGLVWGVAGYGALYVVVYAAVAACVFSKRDL